MIKESLKSRIQQLYGPTYDVIENADGVWASRIVDGRFIAAIFLGMTLNQAFRAIDKEYEELYS